LDARARLPASRQAFHCKPDCPLLCLKGSGGFLWSPPHPTNITQSTSQGFALQSLAQHPDLVYGKKYQISVAMKNFR